MSRIEEIAQEIQFCRSEVLPPYCYNDDEDERDVSEYIEYYGSHVNEAIRNLESYLSALVDLSKSPKTQESIQRVLDERSRFISTFPFCYDELNDFPSDERGEACARLSATYLKDLADGILFDGLRELLVLLEELKKSLSSI